MACRVAGAYNACMDADIEHLTRLTRLHGLDLAKPTSLGNTFIYMAVSNDHVEVVRYLFRMGVDLSAFCDNEAFGSPLFHAIHFESLNVIRLMYDLGVDLDAPCNRFGHTPPKAAEVLSKGHLVPFIERLRGRKDRAATLLVTLFRGVRDRRRYIILRQRFRAALLIQKVIRGKLVRLRLERERRPPLPSSSSSSSWTSSSVTSHKTGGESVATSDALQT